MVSTFECENSHEAENNQGPETEAKIAKDEIIELAERTAQKVCGDLLEGLKRSEKRYQILAENAFDCIFSIDPRTLSFKYVSPAVYKQRGYKPEEVMTQNLNQILTPESLEFALNVLQEEFDNLEENKSNSNHTRVVELEMRHKDGGTIWTETTFSFLYDKNGELAELIGVTRDITERKNLENQLIQSQRMEAIGRLAGGVAHDFNNLLTVIMGYIGFCKENARGQLHDDLNEIAKASERARDLTQQLLAFSRQLPLKLDCINLNFIVMDLQKMLYRLIGEDIDIKMELDEELPNAKLDSSRITQVLMNLIVNARDAMPQGGEIKITTSHKKLQKDYFGINNDVPAGEYICLTVEDRGCGIDKRDLQLIFEPFYTTKSMGEGTGLGLSVTYGIIKQMDGYITVRSEKGKGTIFYIYLPASLSKDEEITQTREETEKLRGNGETILVIEDDKQVCKLIKRMLLRNGYKVISAESVSDALQVFDQDLSNVDFVFSDVVLPDGSGVDLVQKLTLMYPEIKTGLSSGYSDDKSQWGDINELGFPFLQKPYSSTSLLRFIKEHL